MNEYKPDEVSSPLETVKDILAEYRFDRSTMKRIKDMFSRNKVINQETAVELESLLEIPATFWLERQRQYDEYRSELAQLEELKAKYGNTR